MHIIVILERIAAGSVDFPKVCGEKMRYHAVHYFFNIGHRRHLAPDNIGNHAPGLIKQSPELARSLALQSGRHDRGNRHIIDTAVLYKYLAAAHARKRG